MVTETGLGAARPGAPARLPCATGRAGGIARLGCRLEQARDVRNRRGALLALSPATPPRGQEIRKVGGFTIGDRVFHQKFGYGTVRAVEDYRLSIAFEHAGDKKVMDAFVERA